MSIRKTRDQISIACWRSPFFASLVPLLQQGVDLPLGGAGVLFVGLRRGEGTHLDARRFVRRQEEIGRGGEKARHQRIQLRRSLFGSDEARRRRGKGIEAGRLSWRGRRKRAWLRSLRSAARRARTHPRPADRGPSPAPPKRPARKRPPTGVRARGARDAPDPPRAAVRLPAARPGSAPRPGPRSAWTRLASMSGSMAFFPAAFWIIASASVLPGSKLPELASPRRWRPRNRAFRILRSASASRRRGVRLLGARLRGRGRRGRRGRASGRRRIRESLQLADVHVGIRVPRLLPQPLGGGEARVHLQDEVAADQAVADVARGEEVQSVAERREDLLADLHAAGKGCRGRRPANGEELIERIRRWPLLEQRESVSHGHDYRLSSPDADGHRVRSEHLRGPRPRARSSEIADAVRATPGVAAARRLLGRLAQPERADVRRRCRGSSRRPWPRSSTRRSPGST